MVSASPSRRNACNCSTSCSCTPVHKSEMEIQTVPFAVRISRNGQTLQSNGLSCSDKPQPCSVSTGQAYNSSPLSGGATKVCSAPTGTNAVSGPPFPLATQAIPRCHLHQTDSTIDTLHRSFGVKSFSTLHPIPFALSTMNCGNFCI